MPIRALLFDLDGTLVDSERESAEAMARALKAGLGLDVTQRDRDFIIGRSWVDIYQHLCATHGQLPWSRDQLIAATAEHRVHVFAEVGVTILPGAVAAIERFRHLPLGLVTGSSRVEAGQALAALGLEGVFRVIVASEDVSRSKPAPDGYLQAAAALDVPAADCLVIEDSVSGIAAAHAAGARVVAVSAGNFGGHDQSAAHHLLETLDLLTLEFVAAL